MNTQGISFPSFREIFQQSPLDSSKNPKRQRFQGAEGASNRPHRANRRHRPEMPMMPASYGPAVQNAPQPRARESVEFQFSGERYIQEYIHFLAASDPESLEQAGGFADRVEEIVSQVSGELGIDPENVQEFQMVRERSDHIDAQVQYASNPSGTELSASASQSSVERVRVDILQKDGTMISVEQEVRVSRSFSLEMKQSGEAVDPVALDIDGDGAISLTSMKEGQEFDIDADGMLDKTAFVSGADVFLAFDKNQNGRIDDGGELFGDQSGAENVFLELAKYDDDKNGIINSADSAFEQLIGLSLVAGEQKLSSLEELGIKAINLAYENVDQDAQGGNKIAQVSTYETQEGDQRLAADVLLMKTGIDKAV